MAMHDPIDPHVRTQAFYRAFYQNHKRTSHLWYVKDDKHRYEDASFAFVSRFLPEGSSTVTGLHDKDICNAGPRGIRLMHKFEDEVLSKNKELVLFSRDYFCDNAEVNIFILYLKPLSYKDKKCVIVYLDDIFSIYHQAEWVTEVLTGLSENFCPLYKIKRQAVTGLINLLTEKEWEVAWLMISGKSQRWIARHLGIRKQSIDNKIRSIYSKLNINNRDELVAEAGRYGWINFIPSRFLPSAPLIRIG